MTRAPGRRRRHLHRVVRVLLVGLLGGGVGLAMGAVVPPPPVAPGHSVTLLPDGRWLLLGGGGPLTPRGDAIIYDAMTGQATRLALQLATPRRDHTATLLPDGTILVVGGRGTDGALVDGVERLDLAAGTRAVVAASGLTPRAEHTATVLTDGQILLAGGIGADGQALPTIERWDAATQTATATSGLPTSRAGHTATLQADGRVLLWGGTDGQGGRVTGGVLYDPDTDAVAALARRPVDPADAGAPTIIASRPADGATDVGLDGPVGLRVAPPVAVDSVRDGTVMLQGPAGDVAVQLVPVEGGRLVFVTPTASLEPGTPYTLTARDWRDPTGRLVADTTVTFTTQAAPSPSTPMPAEAPRGAEALAAADEARAGGDGVWQPDLTRGLDGWRTGLPPSPWTRVPALHAPPGVTALAGQVLTIWGDPLPDVTLSIGSRATQTDRTGRFLLTRVPAGHQELLIDGRSANRPRRTYGVFEVGVVLTERETTALGYTVWMPVIDTAHTVRIPSPTPDEVVVTTPRIPGLEVRLPGGVGGAGPHGADRARVVDHANAPRPTAVPDSAGREPAGLLHDPAGRRLRVWPERRGAHRLPEPLRVSPGDGPQLLALRSRWRGLVRLRPRPRHPRRGPDPPRPRRVRLRVHRGDGRGGRPAD